MIVLLLVGAFVLGANLTRCRSRRCRTSPRPAACRGAPVRNAFQIKLAQHLVVRRHFTLALEHADRHRVLIVFSGREDSALSWSGSSCCGRSAGEHAAEGFDAQRQWCHVEQQHVLDVALQNAGLNGSAHGNDFIGVHARVRLLAEEFLNRSRTFGMRVMPPTRTTSSMSLGFTPASLRAFLQGSRVRCTRSLDQAFQIGAGDRLDQMLRAGLIGGDERQVDLGLCRDGKLDLRFFSSFLQTLQRQLVLRSGR